MPTYILITIGYKPLVRPEAYRYFFEVRGADIHCIGSKELCESFIDLLSSKGNR